MSTEKTSTPTAEEHSVANPDAAAKAVTAVDPRLLVREQGLMGSWNEFKRKMKAGDLGSIPVVVGLLVIWAIFTSLNGNFLTAGNFSDMSVAMVGTGMIAVGIVFVLRSARSTCRSVPCSGVAGATCSPC
ncbi:D-xylose transport system permease protein OS=Streptomyces albaduncus OX=68172 GN=FHS32_001450 PE=4 SV=1 [Streptomyces griseoloalbus]